MANYSSLGDLELQRKLFKAGFKRKYLPAEAGLQDRSSFLKIQRY
jgi:hypothetical protein